MIYSILRMLLHVIILSSLWFLIQPVLLLQFRKAGSQFNRRMISKNIRSLRRTKAKKWFIYKHIDDLLFMTDRKYEPVVSVIRFTLRSIFISLVVGFSAMVTIGDLPNAFSDNPFLSNADLPGASEIAWKFPSVLALVMLVLPYLFLWSKHLRLRTKNSYDLLQVVKLVSKFASLSPDKALYQAAAVLPDDAGLKRQLITLSQTFTSYSDKEELHEETMRFAALIGTTFAVQFVNELIYAEIEGTRNLKESMFDLSNSMEVQRDAIINVQNNSQEAIQMGFYVNLFVFVATSGSLMYLLGIKVYMKLQFNTPTGMIFITSIVITFLFSFLISIFLSKPKLDY